MDNLSDAELDQIADSLAPFNRRLLLTGAGFSKAWGGLVTSELWSVIVSDPTIRAQVELDRILHDDLNFELVLARIDHTERTDFSAEDRRVMWNAVERAFEIQQQRIDRSLGLHSRDVLDGLTRVFPGSGGTACLFTLNQDLLIERYVERHSESWRLEVPGAQFATAEVTVNDFFADDFRAIRGKRSYIKLHGSMNWKTGDNESVKVLGGAKKESIDTFAILRMNSRIFRRALREPEARLLVIGYGFGDPHINECIAQGNDTGLKIWIVDPRDPDTINRRLRDTNVPGFVWRSVVGHSARAQDLLVRGGEDERLFFDRFWNG